MAWSAKPPQKLEEENGNRVKFRTVLSSEFLQKMKLK